MPWREWIAAAAVAGVACGGSAGAPDPISAPTPVEAAAARPAAPADPYAAIATADMLADVAWLTDPARAGRGSYQDGGRITSVWVERRFRELGLAVQRQPIPGGVDNVIGMLAGDERAVVISAHYDHLGIDGDGTVYPGADDNASGLAVLLAIARAVQDMGGGHTVLFIAFGAEEDALQGSGVYVRDPLWPLDATIAMINFDMVGRNLFEMLGEGQPRTVAVVGLETNEHNRAIAEAAAEAEGLGLFLGSAQLVKQLGFDARTDDWWFRRRGVPTIHFSTGLHRDYHEPTDTPDKLRPEQMTRIARTAARILVELAGLEKPHYRTDKVE